MTQRLELITLPNFPLIKPGDDLATAITNATAAAELTFETGDVVAIAQKVISKAENCYRSLNDVAVDANATALAAEVDKDPRLVSLILEQSRRIIRKARGVLIVENRLGMIHANAGIDQSNIEQNEDTALLLPEDPDASAAALQSALSKACGKQLAVLVNDSTGRPWRNGTCGMAIGTAGFEPLHDLIGHNDMFGRPLRTSVVAVADELAAAASFMMGQADEATPIVIIRGAKLQFNTASNSQALLRPSSQDLFR